MSPEIRTFPPHDPTICSMGRKANPDKLHGLAYTTMRDGQLLPGLAAPVPPEWHAMPREKLNPILKSYMIDPHDFTPHTRFVNLDGNQRKTARWMNGLDYHARILESLPPPLEAVRAGWHANESRLKMSVFDRAEYIDAIRRAMPGANIEQVAKALDGAKPSSIILELQPKNIPEEWRPRTEDLHATVIRVIGGIRKREHMNEALTFACGENVTLAMVKNFIKGQKKSVGRKPSKVETRINGRYLRFEVKHGENREQVIADLKEVIRRLNGYDGDATGIGFILPRA